MNLLLRIFLPFVAGYYVSYAFRSVNALLGPQIATEFGIGAADLGPADVYRIELRHRVISTMRQVVAEFDRMGGYLSGVFGAMSMNTPSPGMLAGGMPGSPSFPGLSSLPGSPSSHSLPPNLANQPSHASLTGPGTAMPLWALRALQEGRGPGRAVFRAIRRRSQQRFRG